MDAEITSAENAQRVVDGHTRGIICSGEVWNQVIDHATAATLDDYMTRLTPELHSYFQRVVLGHGEPRSEQERLLLQLLREWYDKRVA